MSATTGGPEAQTGRPAEAEEPGGVEHLKRNIAVSLAALVLVGTGVAILQVDAGSHESNSARQTTRTAVQAMRAGVVADTVAGLEPVLQAERDFLPYRRPLDAGEPSLAAAAGLPASPQATNGSLRIATQDIPDLGVAPLLARLQFEAEQLTLKQRALATTRITWNDRSTQYTTVIAVLAVALFLVGFALAADGPVRRASFTLGIAVGIFVVLWAAWIYHLPIPSTPDPAINAAARGAVATNDGDYRAAIGDYDRALAADDGYATAYAGRSRARLLAANPDYAVTRAVVDASSRSISGAIDDAHRALALDHGDIVSATLLALTSFYRGDYESAASASADALSINPKVPDLWLLESAIDLARGDQAQAVASLDHALSLLRGSAPSQQTRLLASTYLSYLAWIERHTPARASQARGLADRLVSIETRFTLDRASLPPAPPKTGTATVRGLRYANGRLEAALRWRNLPAGTTLSAIGYERAVAGGAWTQPAAVALFASVAGSGERRIALALQRVCKPTRVRVDIYLNGQRTSTQTGPGVAPTCRRSTS